MKNMRLKLLSAVSFLSFIMMAMPYAEAEITIDNGETVTSPPEGNDDIFFDGPAPGGTFIIGVSHTFVGALTTGSEGGEGVGTLVLNSASSLTGNVGTVLAPLFQITLNGNATIDGATSAEVFNLGQNTLTNIGDLNLPAGTVLNTTVISNALFGNIAVTGANSIAGDSITVNVDAIGALEPNTPLFIISAQEGTSNSTVIVTSNNVLYSFTGENLDGDVTITPTPNPAVLPPGTGGVAEVFTVLLTVAAANQDSDIAAVIADLSALSSVEAIQNALLQFDPIVDGALTRMSFSSAKQFQQIWALHMTNGRCVYPECCDCPPLCNCWEIWVDGFGLWGHQDKQRCFNNSYDANLYGGMIGIQGRICEDFSAGIGGGFAYTDVDRAHDNDSTIKTYDGTVYLSYNPVCWYLDAAFSFNFNQYEDRRRIKFPGIDRTAKADYDGMQYTALLAGGYRFYTCNAIFTPLASLQYSYLSIDKYHECGAQDLNLHVKKQDYHFLESSLGLKAAYLVQTRCGVIVPEVHGLWLYNFYSTPMFIDATFSGVAQEAGVFETIGAGLPRNRGDVGVGITFISCIDLAFEAVYNFEFSQRWHAHQALVKISKQF